MPQTDAETLVQEVSAYLKPKDVAQIEAALAFSIDNLSLTRIERFDGPGAGHGWRVVAVNQSPS